MNSHYPSLELCKKLTEIGFPTTFQHIGDSGGIVIGCGEIPEGMYVCPSVMEMWDIMPTYIWKHNRVDDFYKSELRISKDDVNYHQIEECESIISFPILNNNTLPDCLAQMVIWLNNNNHLPKK